MIYSDYLTMISQLKFCHTQSYKKYSFGISVFNSLCKFYQFLTVFASLIGFNKLPQSVPRSCLGVWCFVADEGDFVCDRANEWTANFGGDTTEEWDRFRDSDPSDFGVGKDSGSASDSVASDRRRPIRKDVDA